MPRRLPFAVAPLLFAAAVGAGPAVAQDAVGEIVVTAQKREERLQDIPLAVQAVGAERLRAAGVRDIRDLQVLTPGMTVTSTTSQASTTARIRGVGTVGDNPGLESSVGVVVDGVYRPRGGVGFGDLGELERIEVLKGPQGTLFGKSTTAGLINVITAQPSFKFSALGEATVSNYGGWGVSGSVTGALAPDKVAGRLFLARRQRDGFLNVQTNGGPRDRLHEDDQNYWTGRAQLLFTPSERARIRVIGDYSKRNETCCGGVAISVGSSPVSRAVLVNQVRAGAEPLAPDPFARVAYLNRSFSNIMTDKGLSVQADVVAGKVDVTSITAYRDWSSDRGADWDNSAADIFYRPDGGYADRFRTLSEELRVSGKTERLDWLVGGFAARELYTGRSELLFGSDYFAYWGGKVLGGAPTLIGATPANTFAPGGGQRDAFKQADTTWALFTNDTVKLTEAWSVTGGLRYTDDKKRLDSTFRTTSGSCGRALAAYSALAAAAGAARAGPIVGGMCLPWSNELIDAASGRQVRDEARWSGSLRTAYRWTPEVMTYAAYARGYKAGGFNFDRPTTALVPGATGLTQRIASTTAFGAETADAYEVGAKTQWFERRLTLNATAFHQTYRDFQLNSFLGTSFIVESIPKVRSQGAELEMAVQGLAPGLTLNGGAVYAMTEYGAFVAADLTDPSRFSGLARLPGSRVSFAPMWSLTGGGAYEAQVGEAMSVRADVSLKYNSAYNTGSDLAPQKIQPAYTLINARLSLGAASGLWRVEAWGMNLTDAHYIQAAFNAPLQGTEADAADIRTYAAFLGAPRTYGLTLRLKR